jgi:D-beta-D-heptose 7-phosphate kinase / D-beta-D-heptose 1-phosphate adenosyltransferase
MSGLDSNKSVPRNFSMPPRSVDDYLSLYSPEEKYKAHTISELICELRTKPHGTRVVLVSGAFDLLHPGHVGYLKAAAMLGDILVVHVAHDSAIRLKKGANRPVIPYQGRVKMLLALRYVNYVLDFDGDTLEAVKIIRPEVVVVPNEHKKEFEDWLCATDGASFEPVFLDRFVDKDCPSTSDLLNRIQTLE